MVVVVHDVEEKGSKSEIINRLISPMHEQKNWVTERTSNVERVGKAAQKGMA